ncbi:MAG TPA: hypothetical protein VF116_14660 [Ktedonobacterales bacterium]
MNEKQRAERILANLEGVNEDLLAVNEDLLAFMDDVGHSIDYRDKASREAGTRFLDEYDQRLDAFRKLTHQLAEMIRGRQGILVEESPGHRTAVTTTSNDPLIANRRQHDLGEEFTSAKPVGFTLQGRGFKNMSTWAELYITVCQEMARRQPLRFRALPDHPGFITVQNNHMFSRDPQHLLTPRLIADGVYAEIKLSANSIRDRIVKLLHEFGVPENAMAIYLRHEPEQDGVA